MIPVFRLDPRCTPDHIGFSPTFLDLNDQRKAQYFLGLFDTREEAHTAYLDANASFTFSNQYRVKT